MPKTIPKIGLEIHGYLTTKEKLFCRCPTNYKTADPNTNICPVCTGQPGSKPMLPNTGALNKVIAISLMLGCKINHRFVWQRKHYDWPDLPKGYQNTISGAHSIPVAEKGEFIGIRITEAHLEEDPAKWDPATGNVDYNRCGMPLIEIVTEPDFNDSETVKEWLNSLLLTLSYIKAVDPDAGIKADVNVSVSIGNDGKSKDFRHAKNSSRIFKQKQGSRVEIKNLNSIDSIGKAIDYEIKRQAKLLENNEKVVHETRTYSDERGITISMRSKEEAADYRFIPDPDLPIMEIDKKAISKIEQSLPELPHVKVKRFMKQYKIDDYTSSILTSNIDLANFFEKVIEKVNDTKLVSTWVTIELLRVLNYNKKLLHEVSINPYHFISLLNMLKEKKITELAAKKILNDFIPKSFDPGAAMKGKEKIEDKGEIEKICKEVISKNPKAVEDYKKGEQKSLNFLIGEVVKASNRRADSRIVASTIIKLLKGR